MSNIRSTIITMLLSAAAGIGTTLFFIWKLFLSKRNERQAAKFVSGAPDELQKQVLEGLQIKGEKTEEQATELKKEIENAKKEEIIYAFEKAFGVGSHHSHKYIDPADSRRD